MLEVLTESGIRNIAVVVTRYFGGTLLGTGGLVRAYTQAVKEGLAHCETGIMRKGCELEVTTDYNDGKAAVLFRTAGHRSCGQHLCGKRKIYFTCPGGKRGKSQKNSTETNSWKGKNWRN